MKQKIIQLILILQLRIGEILNAAEDAISKGEQPAPDVAAATNSHYGQLKALLWVLREISGSEFESLLETIGFRKDDEEIIELSEFDELIEEHGSKAGTIAHIAMKKREEEEPPR